MEGSIRSAIVEDAARLLDIYSHYVENTCVSFEMEAPSLEEFTARVRESLERYAWLVYEVNGEIVGYAYAGPFRARGAYRYTASTSVYIREGYHRQGIGKALYEALFGVLRGRGFYTLVAGVALPNPGSVGLHCAMGFCEVGVYHNVGYKAGGWRDVMHLELPLRAYDTPAGE
jgi:L-amino acid N-acyltransferase YncA